MDWGEEFGLFSLGDTSSSRCRGFGDDAAVVDLKKFHFGTLVLFLPLLIL